jgi:hypothetical protein
MRSTLALALVLVSTSATAATFTVTNTADSGPGSLRQAIFDTSSSAGPHTIQFAIPGGGVHTITPITPFPTITQPTTIDGYTQAGSSPNTLPFPQGLNTVLTIELSGQALPLDLNAKGLVIQAGGTVIRGLAMNRFYITAIEIVVGAGDGVQILGNFLGPAPDGLSVPRGIGVTRQIREGHRGDRRRALRRRQPGHAAIDGRLPAQGQVRALLHAAGMHAPRSLRRRPLPVDLRELDRGAAR